MRKTKMCLHFLEDNCNLGSSCAFAHSTSELHHGPDLHKTQMCVDFLTTGCSDPACAFAHGEDELQPFPCLKQKLCKWHLKDTCSNGYNCRFAHGSDDLRKEPEVATFEPPPSSKITTTDRLSTGTASAPQEEMWHVAPQEKPIYTPVAAIIVCMQPQPPVITTTAVQQKSPVSMPLSLQFLMPPQVPQFQASAPRPTPLASQGCRRKTPLSSKSAPFIPREQEAAPYNVALHTRQVPVEVKESSLGYLGEPSDDQSTSTKISDHGSDEYPDHESDGYMTDGYLTE